MSTTSALRSTKGFEGMMLGATLQDIIQMECLLLTTRAVRVETETSAGRIFFAGGQIVHAAVGDLTGEEAFMEMLSWKNGNFGIEENVRSPDETITRHWQGLLLDAAQRNDETTAMLAQKNQIQAESSVIQLNQGHTMRKEPIVELNEDPEVVASVQFTEDGSLLEYKGEDPETLQASFAYVIQLMKLIGTSLGAENLKEVDLQSRTNKGLCKINEVSTVCFVTTPKANLINMSKKLNS